MDINSSEYRRTIWVNKTDGAKLSAKRPTLKRLPPTDEAYKINFKGAHCAAIMRKNYLSGHPPEIDPYEYDWKQNQDDKTLRPIMRPTEVAIALKQNLEMLFCKCTSVYYKRNQYIFISNDNK